MKVLQICKKFPYPAKDGESIAILNLAKSLHEQGVEVHLLAMNTFRHYFDGEDHPVGLNFYKSVQTVQLDNRIKPFDAFLNLFSKDSYHIQRFISSAFKERLTQLLLANHFDIIQLETLYLTPYIDSIRKNCQGVICLRAHNVEFEIWERISGNAKWGPKKWYLQHLTKKLKNYELAQMDRFDLLAAISERDLQRFRSLGYNGHGHVIPIGLRAQEYDPDFTVFNHPASIGFIGSLDWMPNLEGLDWFLAQVWPQLQAQIPDTKLHIAGRNTPAHLLSLDLPNVVVEGEVDDAKKFINQHPILLVPLFSGSGMRVKILEGMALGRVVLTTTLGLEGINATSGKEVVLADEIEDYLNALPKLVYQIDTLLDIGNAARDLMQKEYDRAHLASQLITQFEKLMGMSAQSLQNNKG